MEHVDDPDEWFERHEIMFGMDVNHGIHYDTVKNLAGLGVFTGAVARIMKIYVKPTVAVANGTYRLTIPARVAERFPASTRVMSVGRERDNLLQREADRARVLFSDFGKLPAARYLTLSEVIVESFSGFDRSKAEKLLRFYRTLVAPSAGLLSLLKVLDLTIDAESLAFKGYPGYPAAIATLEKAVARKASAPEVVERLCDIDMGEWAKF